MVSVRYRGGPLYVLQFGNNCIGKTAFKINKYIISALTKGRSCISAASISSSVTLQGRLSIYEQENARTSNAVCGVQYFHILPMLAQNLQFYGQ